MHIGNGNGKPKKMEKITLGARGEVIPYDFTNIGVEAAPIVGAIHKMMFTELASRSVMQIEEWSQRVINIFAKNGMKTVGDVIFAGENKVQRLVGCGYKARQEIYDTFLTYGLKLEHWNPEKYWQKSVLNPRKVQGE